MAVISLLTDFGLKDGYAGIMKGVILGIDPSAVIVDITHDIDPQDIREAAFHIDAAYRFFPPGTIHVVVVDPGVGSGRSVIALKKSGHFFLFPNNGVLTLLMNDPDIEAIFRVENSRYFLNTVSATFHGRDIFAPVAAHLSKGIPLNDIGVPIDRSELIRLPDIPPSMSSDGKLTGRVISIDRFGNLITNIDARMLEKTFHGESMARAGIQVGETDRRQEIKGISSCYDSVGRYQPLAVIGSRACLEISVNCGSAAEFYHAVKGETVKVTCYG